jgi:D-alanyl-D-alanine carboxypeptidase
MKLAQAPSVEAQRWPAAGAALTVFLVLSAGCGGGPAGAGIAQDGSSASAASTPAASGTDNLRRPRREDWRGFARWLAKRAAAGTFSGAVLIAKDGKPVVKQANGFANRQRRLPNAVGTRFNIGSLGKSLTAVATAQLVQQARLSFDDPIGKYLSGFPPEIADRVTIGQLLTNTSGLGDVFMRWHPTAPVLGAIVEAVSGQNYYDHVRESVFKPAGMTHTGWYTRDQVPNMAHGYTQVDTSGTWIAGNPSGGAYSTVGDLLRFAQALLEHKLLSPQMTKIVLTGKVDTPRPGPAPTKYGYGFEEQFRNGVRIVGNGGGEPGVEAQLRIFPRLGDTVIALTNQEGANRPVLERATRLVTGARRRS